MVDSNEWKISVLNWKKNPSVFCKTLLCPCLIGPVRACNYIELETKAESTNSFILGSLVPLFAICPSIPGTIYRIEIRKKYNITGSTGRDFCTWLFLPCCAYTQEVFEINFRMLQPDVSHEAQF